MGIVEKKMLSYPKTSLAMGIGEKKSLSYPRKAWKWVQERKSVFHTQGKA